MRVDHAQFVKFGSGRGYIYSAGPGSDKVLADNQNRRFNGDPITCRLQFEQVVRIRAGMAESLNVFTAAEVMLAGTGLPTLTENLPPTLTVNLSNIEFDVLGVLSDTRRVMLVDDITDTHGFLHAKTKTQEAVRGLIKKRLAEREKGKTRGVRVNSVGQAWLQNNKPNLA